MDTFGYLYSSTFDPFDPWRNIIESEDDGSGDRQFFLTFFLQRDTTHTLVVTTQPPNVTGPFKVVSQGYGSVNFTRLGECNVCSVFFTKGHMPCN